MEAEPGKELGLRLVDEEMSARRYGEKPRRMTREALKEFFRWASQRGTNEIRRFGRKDLASFHSWLCRRKSKRTGEPLRPGTINNRFASVRLLYSCLYRSGVIAENPCHLLRLAMKASDAYRRRPLSKEEITRFLESIDPTTAQGLRDRTLFELIYSSGLRVAEAASLKVGDIDAEQRFMVVRGKYDRDRKVPISSVAAAFLLRYLGRRIEEPERWVFVGNRGPTKGGHLRSTSISERFRILLRRFEMDIPEISTHSIRHSTATHLLEGGASIRHVQELLGHSCIESTVRYTHLLTENLAKVYRRYHPREHELFEEMDEEYEKRFQAILDHRPVKERHGKTGKHTE